MLGFMLGECNKDDSSKLNRGVSPIIVGPIRSGLTCFYLTDITHEHRHRYRPRGYSLS